MQVMRIIGLVVLLLSVAGMWTTALVLHPMLPARIPLHFDLSGVLDRFGSPSFANWFLLPIIGTVIPFFLVGISFAMWWLLRTVPGIMNLPRKDELLALPLDAQRRALFPIEAVMTWISIAMMIGFAGLLFGTERVATEAWRTLHSWPLFAFILPKSHPDRDADPGGAREPSIFQRMIPTPRTLAPLIALLACACFIAPVDGAQSHADAISSALQDSKANRPEIEKALHDAPTDQKLGMNWLVTHMPRRDLETLSAQFLLDNCDEAYRAWKGARWHDAVSQELFFDCILPYASISETRDEWRTTLREKCAPMIANAKSPGEAAVIINRELFPLIQVKYSTKRKQADQSPRESMESGLASCTGLAIVLVDACRSVGIPARFAGIPMWLDGSGNHSWTEVWDNGWHFTGAAEPDGDNLDKAWFADRVATAKRDQLDHAVYAVTWNESPFRFPTAWREDDDGIVRAINVTDRYAHGNTSVNPGEARVRIRAIDGDAREAVQIAITDAAGKPVFSGTTNDEGFDSNDHLTLRLPIGESFTMTSPDAAPLTLMVDRDEQLVTVKVQRSDSAQAVKELRGFLQAHGTANLQQQPFSSIALSKSDAMKARDLIWKDYSSSVRADRRKELASGVIDVDGVSMPIWFKTYGDKPLGGRSLFISMHGGGGAPKEVNDKQWKNQQRLYEPKEGVYVAPRAPTDTWNLWHEGHIDPLFTRLIEDFVIVEGVNPDRVYIMGYSAGGDGVYQLAPRMADQLAAAAMMAGHPNETKPDGLRNLPFTLHVGENDTPFKRNEIGAQWKVQLDELAAGDPGGYPHLVEIHAGKGHWMDRDDASAVAWMATHARDMRPKRIVWLQDDVTHDRFYWLATMKPQAGARVIASREGQLFTIVDSSTDQPLVLRLDDSMCDLDQPITIKRGDAVVLNERAPRMIGTIARTLLERGDPTASFSAEVAVPATK